MAAANALDPASLYPILVGFDPTATAFMTRLAVGSGGKTFDSNASNVGQAVLDAINVIVSKPPSGDALITATGQAFSAIEGRSFTTTVATITDPDKSAVASEYSASIDWGDGTPTSTGVLNGTGGNFSVQGTHTYTEEGTPKLMVSIVDVDNPSNTTKVNATATVSDVALTASPAGPATSPQSFVGLTATFTDAANPSGTLSDFSATIDWGDSSTSAGTVAGPNGGPYTVSASHRYASTGIFTIATTIKDVGGSSASTSSPTIVFAFAPGGGGFAIGDQNAVVGKSVTFWGAQWSKNNQISGGPAPASFKGFAQSPTTPSCGTSWSADPGNSTPPPAGPIPAYMGVIVTSLATKSGPEIDGNTMHIAVIQTDAGYQPDPGTSGTGKVVALVC
jgi:hypothetical protein